MQDTNKKTFHGHQVTIYVLDAHVCRQLLRAGDRLCRIHNTMTRPNANCLVITASCCQSSCLVILYIVTADWNSIEYVSASHQLLLTLFLAKVHEFVPP